MHLYYALMRMGPYVMTGFLLSGLFLLLVTAPRLKGAGEAGRGSAAAVGIGWAYVAVGIVGLAAVVVAR